VYGAFERGENFVIKKLRYKAKDEIEFVDSEEQTFKLLNASCPYLMSIEDSFKNVFFFVISFFILFL
jgi:hypothetical protein